MIPSPSDDEMRWLSGRAPSWHVATRGTGCRGQRLQRRYAEQVPGVRGSNATKVEGLAGISDLQVMMQIKRIRWAASVYGWHLPELRDKAEQIPQPVLEEDAELRWMSGEGQAGMDVKRVEEWTDGSRMEGRAAGATRKAGLYLGTMATVAGVSMAGGLYDTVALDREGMC